MPICSLRKLSWSSKLGSIRGLRFEQSTVTSSIAKWFCVFLNFPQEINIISSSSHYFYCFIFSLGKTIPVTGVGPICLSQLLLHFQLVLSHVNFSTYNQQLLELDQTRNVAIFQNLQFLSL